MYQVLSVLFYTIRYTVTAVMLGVVLLLLLRLLLHWADVNPFNKISLWTRRLTDPLLFPTQRQMRMMGIDPKFASLVVILLTVLGGFFLIQAAESVFAPLNGLVWAAQSGLVKVAIGFFLYGALSVYSSLLLARIILSWIWSPYQNKLMRFLVRVADPLIDLIRQWLGPALRRYQSYGSPDWSTIVAPMLAMILIYILQRVVAALFLQDVNRHLFI